MSFLIIDTETTGLPDLYQPADAPGQPRAASVAMIFADDNLDVEFEWSAKIKPDGWEMPEEVSRINGLTTDDLAKNGIPIWFSLVFYAAGIDAGRIVVAHNITFDTKIMRGELRRALMRDRRSEMSTICTMLEARRAFRKGGLAHAYWCAFSEVIEGHHGALADARACLRLLKCFRDTTLRRFPDEFVAARAA
jgi:DNA polymerase III epsilon subunit-like protein